MTLQKAKELLGSEPILLAELEKANATFERLTKVRTPSAKPFFASISTKQDLIKVMKSRIEKREEHSEKKAKQDECVNRFKKMLTTSREQRNYLGIDVATKILDCIDEYFEIIGQLSSNEFINTNINSSDIRKYIIEDLENGIKQRKQQIKYKAIDNSMLSKKEIAEYALKNMTDEEKKELLSQFVQ